MANQAISTNLDRASQTPSPPSIFRSKGILTGSVVISSIAMIVLTALTMSGHLTPLVGGSTVLAVGALSGLIESIYSAKAKLPLANRITKIAFIAIQCTLSALLITGILTPTQFGIGMLTTLGSVVFVQLPLFIGIARHQTKKTREQLRAEQQKHESKMIENQKDEYENWLKTHPSATPDDQREKRNDIHFRYNELLLDNHPYTELKILYEKSTDKQKKILRDTAARFIDIDGYELPAKSPPATEKAKNRFFRFVEAQVYLFKNDKDKDAYFMVRNTQLSSTFEDRRAFAVGLGAIQQ